MVPNREAAPLVRGEQAAEVPLWLQIRLLHIVEAVGAGLPHIDLAPGTGRPSGPATIPVTRHGCPLTSSAMKFAPSERTGEAIM